MRFEPKRPIRISDSEILQEIRRVVSECGGVVPTPKEFSRLSKVSIATVRDRFGRRYQDALSRAGFIYTPQRAKYARRAKYSAEKIEADLRGVLIRTEGYRFSHNLYKQYGGSCGRETVKSILGKGSWDEVMDAIGAKHHARQSDDDLLNEIGKVWQAKGRRPTQAEVVQESKIGGEVYTRHFGSWLETITSYCKSEGIAVQGSPGVRVSKEMLVAELRAIQRKRPNDLLTYEFYKDSGGTYSKMTFHNHFGSWTNAVQAVGGVSGKHGKYSIDQLFNEMQRLWELLGQQPTWHEMWKQGKISPKAYGTRFGSWDKAVRAFCDDRNADVEQPTIISEVANASDISAEDLAQVLLDPTPPSIDISQTNGSSPISSASQEISLISASLQSASIKVIHKTPRTPGPRLRWRVFQRDYFKCQICGRAPKDGVQLEADHKDPWDNGGETIYENLWTLCRNCNSGKSNSLIKISEG